MANVHIFKVPLECTDNVEIGGQCTAPRLYGGVQRNAADEAFTIRNNANLVILASNVAGSRIVTLPQLVETSLQKLQEMKQVTATWLLLQPARLQSPL